MDTPKTDSTNSVDIATERFMQSSVFGDEGTIQETEAQAPVEDDAEVEEVTEEAEAEVESVDEDRDPNLSLIHI